MVAPPCPREEGYALSEIVVRPAVAADAAGLVALASAVASEPEGWLLADGGKSSQVQQKKPVNFNLVDHQCP